MIDKTPFLSICIPTFNRAETLKKTLESITNDPFFSNTDKIEVVVSDNCSPDHTRDIVSSFLEKFPKKITYFRNEKNVIDKNFEIALRHGRGCFRKLQNDSFGFQAGLLEPLVKILEQLHKTKPVVFLVNEEPPAGEETLTYCTSMDEFLEKVSYKCTWIGGFGIWAEDIETLGDFSRASNLHLVQTDVLLRLIAQKKSAIVIREAMQPCFLTGRKGGYNIAKVFGANYLSILKKHVTAGMLSRSNYDVEKKRVLVEHTLPFLASKDHDFEIDDFMHHLRDYHEESYFKSALEAALSLGKTLTTESHNTQIAESFEQKWRKANTHNETTCTFPIPLNKISVGKRTYGAITAWHWGNSEERLSIGSFCSIGAGVEFILGGNHAVNGISTFPVKVKYLGYESEALTKGPIIVGDDVWIGNRATIMSGTQIGQGAVVGACSVVSGRVPPYAVVAGNPAKIIRYRFSPKIIEKLMQLDYTKVTDSAIIALAERMYEPLSGSNIDSIISELMCKDVTQQI